VPNSTTRTPASDMLHNTTNGHHQWTSSQQVVDVVQHISSRLNLLYNIFPAIRTWCATHQRTSSQQFYNLLCNKFTTNGQKFATSQHLDMSRCWALSLRRGKFVVQQVVELFTVVQHIRSRYPCSGVWH